MGVSKKKVTLAVGAGVAAAAVGAGIALAVRDDETNVNEQQEGEQTNSENQENGEQNVDPVDPQDGETNVNQEGEQTNSENQESGEQNVDPDESMNPVDPVDPADAVDPVVPVSPVTLESLDWAEVPAALGRIASRGLDAGDASYDYVLSDATLTSYQNVLSDPTREVLDSETGAFQHTLLRDDLQGFHGASQLVSTLGLHYGWAVRPKQDEIPGSAGDEAYVNVGMVGAEVRGTGAAEGGSSLQANSEIAQVVRTYWADRSDADGGEARPFVETQRGYMEQQVLQFELDFEKASDGDLLRAEAIATLGLVETPGDSVGTVSVTVGSVEAHGQDEFIQAASGEGNSEPAEQMIHRFEQEFLAVREVATIERDVPAQGEGDVGNHYWEHSQAEKWEVNGHGVLLFKSGKLAGELSEAQAEKLAAGEGFADLWVPETRDGGGDVATASVEDGMYSMEELQSVGERGVWYSPDTPEEKVEEHVTEEKIEMLYDNLGDFELDVTGYGAGVVTEDGSAEGSGADGSGTIYHWVSYEWSGEMENGEFVLSGMHDLETDGISPVIEALIMS